MFRGIGRRLAVLNALTVITVIALTGGITWLALRAALDDEVDNALRERIETYVGNPALFEEPLQTPTHRLAGKTTRSTMTTSTMTTSATARS